MRHKQARHGVCDAVIAHANWHARNRASWTVRARSVARAAGGGRGGGARVAHVPRRADVNAGRVAARTGGVSTRCTLRLHATAHHTTNNNTKRKNTVRGRQRRQQQQQQQCEHIVPNAVRARLANSLRGARGDAGGGGGAVVPNIHGSWRCGACAAVQVHGATGHGVVDARRLRTVVPRQARPAAVRG